MSTNRREFVTLSALASSVLSLTPSVVAAATGTDKKSPAKGGKAGSSLEPGRSDKGNRTPEKRSGGKSILILGGTGFLGPHLVEAARARNHTVTLFNRGKTHPEFFPDVEKLRGDRDGDLKALEGRKWDAVIDPSGYVPRLVKASAELLKDAVSHYVFISSISVYADLSHAGVDESAPVMVIPDPTVETMGGGNYGALKALCEQAAEKAMPGRVTNVRPGLIVGPLDPTDRFTYWPARIDRGGEVLAPGTPDDPVQIIDVRDLSDWIIHLIEAGPGGGAAGNAGIFNALGPKGVMTISEMLHGCWAVSGSETTFTWADAAFLETQNVSPWSDMPVWIPPEDAASRGHAGISNARAVARGLTFRPLAVTVRDTLDWFKSLPEERRSKLKAGLTPQREAEVLAAWHARKK